MVLASGILLCIMEQSNLAPSHLDPLTGLWRAQPAIEALGRRIQTCAWSEPVSVAVIFADIFRLKDAASTYGHAPAEAAIIAVAGVLSSLAREGEIACRYGGDEFLLVMPAVTEPQARERAQALRAAVAQLRVICEGEPQEHLVLSVGVAHLAQLFRSTRKSSLRGAEALMRKADAELERDRERNHARFPRQSEA